MANPKTGFDYFSVDTDRFQDIRIKRLKKDMGCQGFAVYEYILNEIYRVRGCFLEWDESTAFDVAEYWGLKESVVHEIVRYCGAVGLFDKELLSGGIITSASIQSRYLQMSQRARRQKIIIPEECKIITEECKIITEESSKLPEVCRKVKESKVIKEKSTNVDKKKSDDVAVEACSIDEVVDSFMNSHGITLDGFCKNNGIDRNKFSVLMHETLTEWELKGWVPSKIKKGRGEYESQHFLNTIRIKINQSKPNEDNKTDRLQRRRGSEPVVKDRKSFNGTF